MGVWDDGSDHWVVSTSQVLGAGAHAVLGASADTGTNGGAPVDASTVPYGAGDLGSPGAANEPCDCTPLSSDVTNGVCRDEDNGCGGTMTCAADGCEPEESLGRVVVEGTCSGSDSFGVLQQYGCGVVSMGSCPTRCSAHRSTASSWWGT